MNNLTFVRRNEIIKSINSQSNESPGNDGFTAEYYKHFYNELAHVLC